MSDALETSPTESAAVEQPSAEPTEAQLIEAASSALEEAAEEPVAQPDEAAEEQPEAAEAAPEATEEPEPAPDPEKVALDKRRAQEKAENSEFARVRRMEQRVKAAQAEADRRFEELRAKEAAVAEADALAQLLRDNPVRGFERLAERAGMKGHEALERLQRNYLNDGKPDEHDLREEIRSLKESIEQRDARMAQEREQARQVRTQQQHVEERNGWVDKLATVVTGEAAAKYPYLAAASKANPDVFRSQIEMAIDWTYQHAPGMPAEELLEYLDTQERQSYDRYNSFDLQATSPADAENEASGSAHPANAQRPPGATVRTVTANDAANGSGTRREMTEAERIKAADKLFYG